MTVVNQFQSMTTVRDFCSRTFLSHSNFYYSPTNGRKGILPSTTTSKMDGTIVGNDEVVDKIRKVLSNEFVCYGYQNITVELRNEGYVINHKKVYRLMDENQLLLGKTIKTQGKRDWVKFRRINASRPMKYLSWDIKYVWVDGEKKNYYLLSLMDVCTRRIMDWIFQGSVRKIDLMKMISRVDIKHGLKGVTVRNDNCSQFIANKVRHYLLTIEARQEFTHIATPEENAYIEAFHSIFEREVIRRFQFASFYEAKLTIAAYMDFYNNRRLHGSLKRRPPIAKWNEYYGSFSSDKPQSAQESEVMSRVPSGTRLALDIAGDSAKFAYRMMNEFNSEKELNSFNENVQLIGG